MEPGNIDAILENRGAEPFDIMEVLQDVQASYGYLPEEILRQVSASFDVPLIEVFRLASFYKAFSLTPRGRHLVTVCTGTACHVRGAPKMLTEVTAQLAIQPGETTHDRAFTLETVNCLGACALGPVVVLDGQYHDHMDPDQAPGASRFGARGGSGGRGPRRGGRRCRRPVGHAADRGGRQCLDSITPRRWSRFAEELAKERGSYEFTLTMCAGTACRACGCLPVAEAMAEEIARQGLSDKVQLRLTGCHGFCEQGPLAIVDPAGVFYCRLSVEDVPDIVARTLKSGEVIPGLLYTDPVSGKAVELESQIPFYAAQERCLLGDNRRVAPTSIDDYIAVGGYSALAKAADHHGARSGDR